MDENPEITAWSPAAALMILSSRSVLPPPEKVSEPAISELEVFNSTVPPPLSTVLLAVLPPLMNSLPPLSTVVPVAMPLYKSMTPPLKTVSLVTVVAAAPVMVNVPEIWSPVAEPPDEIVSEPPAKIVVAELMPFEPTDILPPLEIVVEVAVPPLLTTSVPPFSTFADTTAPLDMTVSVTPELTVSPVVVPLDIVGMS